MPTPYRILVTSFFERDVTRQGKKDRRTFKEIENIKAILAVDPYNLTRRYDIKKLKGIKPGEGQFRIRVKDYRLRYDIFGLDVVLYSFRHRRDIYEVGDDLGDVGSETTCQNPPNARIVSQTSSLCGED